MSYMADRVSRKLDALVAEHVMGFVWLSGHRGLRGLFPVDSPSTAGFTPATGAEQLYADVYREVPDYSTSIADALTVLETFDGEWWVELTRQGDFRCRIFLPVSNRLYVGHSEGCLAEAICIAALRTKGIEGE